MLILTSSVFVIYLLWNSYAAALIPFNHLLLVLLLLMLVNSVAFIAFKTFSGILRYSSFSDLAKIVYALTIGYGITLVFVSILSYSGDRFVFNWKVVFLTFILNVVLMVLSRIVVKEVYDAINGQSDSYQDIFVYGTNLPAIRIAKSLSGSNDLNLKLRGFISDEEHMVGKHILGVKVYDTGDDLFRALEQLSIKK